MVELRLKVCVVEDKTAVVAVALYRSVSRNSVFLKALWLIDCSNSCITDWPKKYLTNLKVTQIQKDE